MNCKPGDLAVIVRSLDSPEAIGSLVKCVSFLSGLRNPSWQLDRKVADDKLRDGKLIRGDWFADKCLRPIRDQDGEDEMIRIAGKPNKEKVDG